MISKRHTKVIIMEELVLNLRNVRDADSLQVIITKITSLLAFMEERQEVKPILEEAISILLSQTLELDDDTSLKNLLVDLAHAGQEIGNWILALLKNDPQSELQLKLLEYLSIVFNESLKIRKVKLAILITIYIESISGDLPIRLAEALNTLSDLIISYLLPASSNREPQATCFLHPEKVDVFELWLGNPDIDRTIKGNLMRKFILKETNFEVLLEIILVTGQGLEELIIVYSYIKKNLKKFDPDLKIVMTVKEALSSFTNDLIVQSACKLLEMASRQKRNRIIYHIINTQTTAVLLKHIDYSEMQHVLHICILANKIMSGEEQSLVINVFLPELLERFVSILQKGSIQSKMSVFDLLEAMIPEIFVESQEFCSDDAEDRASTIRYPYYRKIFIDKMDLVIQKSNKIAFKLWDKDDSPEETDLKFSYSSLFCLLLDTAKIDKVIKVFLGRDLNKSTFANIQKCITHLSVNKHLEKVQLNAYEVRRPASILQIQLAQSMSRCLDVFPDLVNRITVNSLAILFFWVDIFRSNGMLLSSVLNIINHAFLKAEEKTLYELMIGKHIFTKFLQFYKSPPTGDINRDFNSAVKRIIAVFSQYTENNCSKNKLTKAILSNQVWKNIFQIQTEPVILRPTVISRSGKKTKPFILGINPLEPVKQKIVPKPDFSIEQLAQEIDTIINSSNN